MLFLVRFFVFSFSQIVVSISYSLEFVCCFFFVSLLLFFHTEFVHLNVIHHTYMHSIIIMHEYKCALTYAFTHQLQNIPYLNEFQAKISNIFWRKQNNQRKITPHLRCCSKRISFFFSFFVSQNNKNTTNTHTTKNWELKISNAKAHTFPLDFSDWNFINFIH